MKIGICVGNPPYQQENIKNTQPLWPEFIKVGNALSDKTTFVHPARWLFNQKNAKQVKEEMLKQGLKSFYYYDDSSYVFREVSVSGGISISNYEKKYKGKITYSQEDDQLREFNPNSLFTGNKFKEEVVEKLLNKIKTNKSMKDYQTTGYDIKKECKSEDVKRDSKGLKNPIQIEYNFSSSIGSKREWGFISRDNLSESVKNNLLKNKVCVDCFGHKGDIFTRTPVILSSSQVTVRANTFIPNKDCAYELKLIQSLFCTKTARFLMSFTQYGMNVGGFENVPDYTYFMKELQDKNDPNYQYAQKWNDPEDKNKEKGLFTDEWFYHKFNFSRELQNYIESHLTEKKVS